MEYIWSFVPATIDLGVTLLWSKISPNSFHQVHMSGTSRNPLTRYIRKAQLILNKNIKIKINTPTKGFRFHTE